jgi:hypothetical protein
MKLLSITFVAWIAMSLVLVTSLAAALPILQIEHLHSHHGTDDAGADRSVRSDSERHDHESHSHDDWGVEWLSQLMDDHGLGQLGTSLLTGASSSSFPQDLYTAHLPSIPGRMVSRPPDPLHPPPRLGVASA